MDVLTYDELRMIEREERSNKQLFELSEDFIERFHAYVNDKQRVLDKSDDNIIAQKVKERTKSELFNARNSFKRISECRVKKIFDQVMLDLRMGVNPDFKGLLPFEKEFYEKTRSALSDHFDQLVKRKLKKEDSSQPLVKDNNVLVRFVKEFPEFVWNDLTLGPFSPEDVANLPLDAVKLLLSKGVVKEVLGE